MKTTKQLSNAYVALQEEALEKIKSFFKNKSIIRLTVDNELSIYVGKNKMQILELYSDGRFMYILNKRIRTYLYQPKFEGELSVDALLTILDELERMKKEGKLNLN